MNLLEERQRLIDQYTNEAAPGGVDEATFVDFPSVCTKAELVNMATNVMNPLANMMNNAAVTTRSRIPDITPLISDQL